MPDKISSRSIDPLLVIACQKVYTGCLCTHTDIYLLNCTHTVKQINVTKSLKNRNTYFSDYKENVVLPYVKNLLSVSLLIITLITVIDNSKQYVLISLQSYFVLKCRFAAQQRVEAYKEECRRHCERKLHCNSNSRRTIRASEIFTPELS